MSGADPRRYQPVSVEDWDDEAQTSIPGTRTTANVAVKRDLSNEFDFASPLIRYKYDDTDSGYSSKATTVSSMASSNRRRLSDLKVNTAVPIERERKPYAMTATPRAGDHPTISHTAQEKGTKEQPKPVKKPFCHKEGICWVCDRFGFHFDPKDPPKDLPARKEAAKPTKSTPIPSTQPPKVAAPKSKTEDAPRPPARRMSSNQSRPISMYAGTPLQTSYPPYPAMQGGWQAPPPPPGIAYTSYPYMTPGTPVAYVLPHNQQYFSYEPQPAQRDCIGVQQKPARRMSTIVQERPLLEKKPSRTSATLERPLSREQRPQIVSHKSARSIDADKLAMPPPPPPKLLNPTTVNATRPRPSRSNTYHSNNSSNRWVQYEDSENDSQEEEEPADTRATTSYRQHPPSPRRPPSSYKPHTQPETAERPQLTQKAKSYHDASNTMHVATAARVDSMLRRRTTESVPATSFEQKEVDAEAYMRKRSSMPVVDLTAENLKNLKSVASRQLNDQRSDAGSTTSHLTHQSSSKGSSTGRGRVVSTSSAERRAKGTSMNININGINLNITDGGNSNGEGPPVKLDLGGIQISMNNKDKENADHYKQPQKQLERAPSMSSRPSRRSLTQGSLVSAAANGQKREKDEILAIEGTRDSREYSRRESHVDEDERELLRQLKAKSSRQASRNTSTARPPLEDHVRPRVQSHRSSVDYSRRDEPVM